MSVSKIEKIQWSTLSSEQWRAYAVVNVTKPSPKEYSNDVENRANTPYDPLMGEQRDLAKCATCFKTSMECPGHFGNIILPFCVYNRIFTAMTIKLLQCVCPHCARLRIIPSHMKMLGLLKYKGFAKLKAIADKCNKSFKVCPWEDCREPLIYFSMPVKKKGEHGVIYYTVGTGTSSGKREEYIADDAFDVFSRISDEDLELMGFNDALLKHLQYINSDFLPNEMYSHAHQFRPESMIYTDVPVLPPISRSYIQDEDGIKDDDITTKYNELIKSINIYKTFKSENDDAGTRKSTVSTRRGRVKTKADVERDIMEHVWTLANNKDEKGKSTNVNKAYRSIVCRLIYKDGRIQQNVGGKRTNYSARTVIIGGGIRLKNDELGVPRDIAEIESKPIFVGPWNIEEVQNLIKNKQANYVIRIIDGETTKTNLTQRSDRNSEFVLKYGDTVGRHLQDGDIVFFNRQPTLRIESMMAFRVKIVEGMAFMLGLAWTRGFNADFDGPRFGISFKLVPRN
jgi:DNA-directed RNA polymerase beta' subunit